MPSEYQAFVKQHFHSAPGGSAPEKMKAIGAAWRKHKSQRGGNVDIDPSANTSGAGVHKAAVPKARRRRIVAPAGGAEHGSGTMFEGGGLAFSGGSAVDALRAANQGSEATLYGGMLHGHQMNGGKFTFNDFLNGFSKVATAVGPILGAAKFMV